MHYPVQESVYQILSLLSGFVALSKILILQFPQTWPGIYQKHRLFISSTCFGMPYRLCTIHTMKYLSYIGKYGIYFSSGQVEHSNLEHIPIQDPFNKFIPTYNVHHPYTPSHSTGELHFLQVSFFWSF